MITVRATARLIVVFMLVLFLVPPVFGTTIALHTGANNPLSELWTYHENGTGVLVGALSPDDGYGCDAWYVDDQVGYYGYYSYALTADQVQAADDYGWRLAAFLRLPDIPDPAAAGDGSPFISYRDGSHIFQLHFGTQDDGDPIVRLYAANHSYAIEGGGAGYHSYVLEYQPGNGVSFLVDGTEYLSGWSGASFSSSPVVLWGAASSRPTGRGNFNRVEFETVPEPATAWLLLAGVALLCCSTGKRKRLFARVRKNETGQEEW
ncbi:MAG: PEP-CTERM sorting domain-containing protein [Deltaproteobacteria bacterium]|nr:PEP-CTERM sorting domain-containing protein [Deltaproteobacteria bacterium]